jgi:hypothetical protein
VPRYPSKSQFVNLPKPPDGVCILSSVAQFDPGALSRIQGCDRLRNVHGYLHSHEHAAKPPINAAARRLFPPNKQCHSLDPGLVHSAAQSSALSGRVRKASVMHTILTAGCLGKPQVGNVMARYSDQACLQNHVFAGSRLACTAAGTRAIVFLESLVCPTS